MNRMHVQHMSRLHVLVAISDHSSEACHIVHCTKVIMLDPV